MRLLTTTLCIGLLVVSCRPAAVSLPNRRDSGAVYSALIDATLFEDSTRGLFDFSGPEPPMQIELLSIVAPMVADSARVDSTRAWLTREIPGLPASLVAGYAPAADTIPLDVNIIARVPIVRLTISQFRERATSAWPA